MNFKGEANLSVVTLNIQVCSDPTPIHCNTGQGKMHSPLFSAALQNRLIAGLCHCNYTHQDLLYIQVCRNNTNSLHTGQGKMHSPLFSAALQNSLTAGLFHCKYTCQDLLYIQVCSEPTLLKFRQSVTALIHMEICSSGSQHALCHCNYTYGGRLFVQVAGIQHQCTYRCAVTQHRCTATRFRV